MPFFSRFPIELLRSSQEVGPAGPDSGPGILGDLLENLRKKCALKGFVRGKSCQNRTTIAENARKCLRAGALNLPVLLKWAKCGAPAQGGFPRGKNPGVENFHLAVESLTRMIFLRFFWVGIFLGRGFFQLGNPDEECGIRKRAVVCILCERALASEAQK